LVKKSNKTPATAGGHWRISIMFILSRDLVSLIQGLQQMPDQHHGLGPGGRVFALPFGQRTISDVRLYCSKTFFAFSSLILFPTPNLRKYYTVDLLYSYLWSMQWRKRAFTGNPEGLFVCHQGVYSGRKEEIKRPPKYSV